MLHLISVLSVVMLNVVMLSVRFFVVMLSAVMQSVVFLSALMILSDAFFIFTPSVIISNGDRLNVVAPNKG